MSEGMVVLRTLVPRSPVRALIAVSALTAAGSALQIADLAADEVYTAHSSRGLLWGAAALCLAVALGALFSSLSGIQLESTLVCSAGVQTGMAALLGFYYSNETVLFQAGTLTKTLTGGVAAMTGALLYRRTGSRT
ncbi:hypothetical protein ACIQ9Q_42895 [Streptomyces sp. NPDC094438]|uniref:hypothetical protein n=1 Tax=Streptomyces sp. NPDC094438 TaxID=3366061 RepID=UPI003819D9EA